MNTFLVTFLIADSVIIGFIRVMGDKGQLFQAVAHLWVGILIGGAIGNKPNRPLLVTLAVALSVLEVACFLIFRGRG